MDMSINLDISAVIVIAILLFAAYFRKMTGSTSGRIFVMMMCVAFFAAFSSFYTNYLQQLVLNGGASSSDTLINIRYVCHYVYLATRNFTIVSYLAYIISLTDTWHKIKVNNGYKLLMVIPYGVTLMLLVINIFTHKLFFIDSEFIYRRGPLFVMLYFIALIYCVFAFIYLHSHKQFFSKDKLISMYAIFPLTLTSVLLQWLFPNFHVEMFATAVALLMLTITVERPEEQIDSFTGLTKFSAYARDMRKNFINNKPVRIVAINISNFSSVGKILGYDSTNLLLEEVSAKLTKICENNHNIELYYLDRGRFRAVIKSDNDLLANEIANKVNTYLSEDIVINNLRLSLVAHVCIVKCPEDIDNFKMLMSFDSGFDQHMPYTGQVSHISDMSGAKRLSVTNELDSIIDNAITNNKFKVYYQPIYSVEQNRFVSAEALLRLIDDEHGFIPPDIFITAAEKSGAIHKIGEFVIEDVCRFISGDDFKKLGLDYIEINLSVAQCMHADLADTILNILDKYKVSPDKINLEITETAANVAQSIMTRNLEKLSAADVSFSLDDYGTGYSNIKSVASLPLKIVKLDKTFVNMEDNPRMWIVLKNTIKMLKEMNMEIVVEGVETKETSDKFADLKCEYIQGYYYSRPLPENDFVSFMMAATGN